MDLTPIWLLEVMAVVVVVATLVFVVRAMHREAEERRADQ